VWLVNSIYNGDVPGDSLTRDDVMTAEQVAAMLHCSRRRVYDLVRRDELPGARHLGRTVIVIRPVLEAWLLTGRTPDH
jgi:excisionase family DNA binding protein